MTGNTSFFELISKGGLVMIPIGLCSVIGLAIIIERLYFRKRFEVGVINCFCWWLDGRIELGDPFPNGTAAANKCLPSLHG